MNWLGAGAVVAAIAAVAYLLTGADRDPEGMITVTYGCFGTPEQIVMERRLMDYFEQQHPGIRVKLRTPSSGNYMTKLMTELAGRVAPDVTFMGVEDFQSFADKKVFLSLDPYIAADPECRAEGYFPEILKAFTHHGRVMALPKNAASDVIFYNKDHFDKEGISYPDETWSWDDLVSASVRLTKDMNGDGRRDRFGLANIQFLDYLRQHGVELISEDGTRCTLNTPKARECCQFAYDLMYKHHAIPSQTQMAAFGMSGGGASGAGFFDLFADQHVSMMIFDVVLALKYEKSPFDWDTAVQPGGPTRETYIHGAGYAINARSRHPDESWKLVKFLAGNYVQTERAVAGDSLPSLKQIAAADVWRITERKPRNRDAVTTQMLTARPPPPHPRWPRILSEFYQMHGEFISEENPLPIDVALAQAEYRINRILRNED